ncbi:hypothetical protein AMECASPLE_031329 [Ameca splendens]|uniref:Uncharacterized protein n=1 Tax=Ameca splendens TaxID=208324 RepID=A0ABV0YHP9_9TELE
MFRSNAYGKIMFDLVFDSLNMICFLVSPRKSVFVFVLNLIFSSIVLTLKCFTCQDENDTVCKTVTECHSSNQYCKTYKKGDTFSRSCEEFCAEDFFTVCCQEDFC